jgi:hypothetical protein
VEELIARRDEILNELHDEPQNDELLAELAKVEAALRGQPADPT